MFRGLFKSKEVKLVLAELHTIGEEQGASGLAFIKDLVVQEINSQPQASTDLILRDKLKVRDVTLMAIMTVLVRELASGKHHVYRGSLGMVGLELEKLWSFCVEQLKLSGYSSDNDVAENMAFIQKAIKSVG